LESTPPASEKSGSCLCHLIPAADDESDFTGTENPILLADLFDFDSDGWVNIYHGYARRHITEELTLCELLNQDAATDEGAVVDVDEMTGDILLS
jgi:hypothetical protein